MAETKNLKKTASQHIQNQQDTPNERGYRHWAFQRLSALALIPLAVWFAVSMIQPPLENYQMIYAWMSGNVTAILMALIVLIASYHAAVGLKEVYTDYIHRQGFFLAACYLTYALAVILAIIGLFSIYKIWHTAL